MNGKVTSEWIEVRHSNVHGLGVFATKAIPKGTRLIEYVGERVSHNEADRRYEDKDENDSHTFLFIVDSKTVIDAGVDGNDARYFNHSCDPNCESVIESRRVYIEAIRDIAAGAELTYDYQIHREDDDPENIDEVFACRCGFPQCRGTMLWPTERKPPRRRGKKRAAAKKKKAAPQRNPARRERQPQAKRASGAKRASQKRAKPELRAKRAPVRKSGRKSAGQSSSTRGKRGGRSR